MESVHINVCIQ